MWIISQFLKIIFTGKYPVFFWGGGFEEGGGVNLGTVTIYTMFPIIFYVLVFNLLLGFIVCFIFKFFVYFYIFAFMFCFCFCFVLFCFCFCFVFFFGAGGGGGGGGREAPLSSNQYLQLLSMAHLNNEPEFYKLIIGWYLLYFFCFEGGNQFGYTLKYRFFLYMYFLYPYLWF